MTELLEKRAVISAQCTSCKVSLGNSITSRRCFMTGGYCSKQRTVQEERKKLHSKNEINAFMVMNFSDMSNMQYNRKIKKFIEGLKNCLYLSEDQIMCCASPNQEQDSPAWHKVSKINVIRADTTYASNFVMCSRVCQQMLIADLVVVDVSIENANVFYELGMAVALGKLILPICSRESYFKRTSPSEEVKKRIEESHLISEKELSYHIGYYPWRKKLFEYYGIRFRNTEHSRRFNGNLTESQKYHEDKELREKITRYIDFEYVKDPALELSDQYLAHFPYSDEICLDILDQEQSDRSTVRGVIGQAIYRRLQRSYNYAGYCDNTVVIYISDSFLNQKQAGQCIINYYNAITKQMQHAGCFCGDRVGVLVQESKIPDNGKDSRRNDSVLYGTSGVFVVAVNEATYKAQQRHIFPKDVKQNMGPYLRDYIHNRGMTIYPDKPVYVKRVRDGRQMEIWGEMAEDSYVSPEMDRYICLYHVMLENMKCVQQVVVDITDNSHQSLFWLGAAHGANIYAISVKWERTEKEREELVNEAKKEGETDTAYLMKQDRHIFDVAGLWTAILRTNDIDGFYRQIAVAQMDIDQHSKLVLHTNDDEWPAVNHLQGKTTEKSAQQYWLALEKQQQEEADKLESYYRGRFWKSMLQYNSLQLYLEHNNGTVKPHAGGGEMQRSFMIKWDVDSAAILSDYLSKRMMIGEYQIESLEKEKYSEYADKKNFLCIGANVGPLRNTGRESSPAVQLTDGIYAFLKEHPFEKYGHVNKLWKKMNCNGYPCRQQEADGTDGNETIKCRGFRLQGNACGNPCVFTQTLSPNEIREGKETTPCQMSDAARKAGRYSECRDILLAQLLLWREVPADEDAKILYRVALNGTSGPATKALTHLLVDEEQMVKIFSEHSMLKRQIAGFVMEEKINSSTLAMLRGQIDGYLEKSSGDEEACQDGELKTLREKMEQYQSPKEDAFSCQEEKTDEAWMALKEAMMQYLSGGKKEENAPEKQNTDERQISLKKQAEAYIREMRYDIHLLSQLQEEIREKFQKLYTQAFVEELKALLRKSEETHQYIISCFQREAENYLESVLYQYFLPFLSRQDEVRLVHGLRYFLRSYGAATAEDEQWDTGIDTSQIIDTIVAALEELLTSFRGVEAFYEVKVKSASIAKDSRTIENIRLISDDARLTLNCHFARKTEK